MINIEALDQGYSKFTIKPKTEKLTVSLLDVAALNGKYSEFSIKPKIEKLRTAIRPKTTELAAFLEKNMVPMTLGTTMGLIPVFVYAAGAADDTFNNIHSAAMNAFDGGTVLIIIFAGACWMLGHRSRAIELLLCASCGYLVARHAVDIRDFLKTI